MQSLDLVAGAGSRDLSFDFIGHLRERLDGGRGDVLDADDDRAELALQRPAYAPLRQGEDRVGLGFVEHRVFCRLAEVGVLRLQSPLLDEIIESRAGLELGVGRGGVGLVRKQDLLKVALLGRPEPRILAGELFIGGVSVRVAHFGRIGDRVRLQGQHVHRPQFGRPVTRLAIVEEGLERLLGRRGNVARGARGKEEIIDRSGLPLVVGLRLGLGVGSGNARGQGRHDELPQGLLAQFRDEAALGHVHVAQRAGEAGRVERSGLVAEIRI